VELRSKGELCLVGRLEVAKKINKEAFKATMARIWKLEGRFFFKEIQPNLWLIELALLSDKHRILVGRPWSYARTILVLNEFDGRVPPSQMDFSMSPIWIHIHDMPLGCMNRGVGLKIGGTLGYVEEVAVAKDDVGWGRFLRVRVIINLYNPLERGRSLIISGNTCWVSMRYEKLPDFCYRCGQILHDNKGCPVKASPLDTHYDGNLAWGAWLRAEEACRNSDELEVDVKATTAPNLATQAAEKPCPKEGVGGDFPPLKERSIKSGNPSRYTRADSRKSHDISQNGNCRVSRDDRYGKNEEGKLEDVSTGGRHSKGVTNKGISKRGLNFKSKSSIPSEVAGPKKLVPKRGSSCGSKSGKYQQKWRQEVRGPQELVQTSPKYVACTVEFVPEAPSVISAPPLHPRGLVDNGQQDQEGVRREVTVRGS